MASPVNPVSPISAPPAPPPPPPQEEPPPPAEAQPQEAAPQASTPSAPVATTTQDTTTQTTAPSTQVPAGKTLVPGFGIVLSLEILNKPMQVQQIQLNDALAYQQELPYDIKQSQGILLELLTENTIVSDFWGISTDKWNDLYRHNNLQPSYSGD
jgi:hypothetical protein